MSTSVAGAQQQRKAVRACDFCHMKKIRCNGASPVCSNCANVGISCTYTQVKKPRKTPVRSAKRIEFLERRMRDMEALLTVSEFSRPSTANATEMGKQELQGSQVLQTQPNPTVTSASRTTIPLQPVSGRDSTSFIDEDHSTTTSSATPPANSSSASKASDSVDWRMELAPTRPGMTSDGLYYLPEGRHAKRGLPPLKELLLLLQEYFDSFNFVIPLYPQEEFMRDVQEHHPKGIHNDTSLWAAVCVTLALAYRLRALRAVRTSDDDLISWGYLQNALEVVPELTLSHNSGLCGITAILGMAIFLQATPHVQPASVLVATAIRMSSAEGLHRKDPNSRFSAMEAEQRSRVVWIAYFLDRDFSLRLNQPPMPNDDDLDVDPPNEHPPDNLGFIQNLAANSRINYFYLRVRLGIIQSNIYRELHSTKASKQSNEDRAIGVQALLLMLEEWKRSIPPDFQPESLTRCLPKSAILHMVVLHLSYFNCLTTIHGVSYHNSRWTTRLTSGIDRCHDMEASEEECLEAARTAIRLIKLLPPGDYAWIWLLLYYYVSGIVILLAHVLRHPEDPAAQSDIELVRPLIRLLKDLSEKPSTMKLERVYDFCFDLESRAKAAVHSTGNSGNRMQITHNSFALAGDLTADDFLDDTIHEWLISGYGSDGVRASEQGTEGFEAGDLSQYAIENYNMTDVQLGKTV